MIAVPAPDNCPDAGAVRHYGDPLGEQRAAEHDAAVIDRSNRAVMALTGADRRSWLHSISTQHVAEGPPTAPAPRTLAASMVRAGVEDHWLQTELGDVTYLDTEPWRGEPLLAYLKKMVFSSDVA